MDQGPPGRDDDKGRERERGADSSCVGRKGQEEMRRLCVEKVSYPSIGELRPTDERKILL